MKSLPSSQFRVVYASLTEPVTVTVVGRPIGVWTPVPLDPHFNRTVSELIDKTIAVVDAPQPEKLPPLPLTPEQRASVAATGAVIERNLKEAREKHPGALPTTKRAQAQRDAVLRGVNKGKTL